MPGWVNHKRAISEQYSGQSFLQSQTVLLGVALSVAAIQWLLLGHDSLVSTLIYTLVAGNVVTFPLSLARPLSPTGSTRHWVIFLVLLVPVALLASLAGGLVDYAITGRPLRSLLNWKGDIPYGALICAILGVIVHIFQINRMRLQAANQQLAQQVQYGQQELAAQASELRDAFEIQRSLLPRTIPQIYGVEISCAWQPARTVSGDYFDVLVLSDTRIAFCLADVSGKGMSAALITANLQATLRAFAPDETSPARLCHRLNQALCASLPVGRFVTLAYGILDRTRMTLTYELAGHNAPLLLRGGEIIALPGTGPVLGMLPGASYADQTVALEPGDQLILSTDGVTEAFSAEGEEFGEERMVAAARQARSSAHAVRTEVMRVVGEFAEGNFHDDASLMVVQVG